MSIEISPVRHARHEPQMFFASANESQKPQDPAAEVGFFLKRERAMRGLTIEMAGDATGIHPYHLEAIESGDLTHMPPRLEALEMIAGYAQFLGFEPEPLIEHLLSFLPPPPIARDTSRPAQPHVLSSAKVLRFGKLPKIPSFNIRLANYPGGARGLITTASAAVVMMVGAHFALSHQTVSSAPATEQVASAPAASLAVQPVAKAEVAATEPVVPEGNKMAELAAPVGDAPDAIGALIKDQTKDGVVPAKTKPSKNVTASAKIQDRLKSADQVKTASISAIPAPSAGRDFGGENKDAHLVLKALAPVYLRVEDAQGIPVLAQMLNTGDSYHVPNRQGLVALSRDGGRLAYVIDGQDKGVLGVPGKILISEKLDLAVLQAKK